MALKTARDLMLERSRMVADARAVSEKAESEERDFTAEEQTQYDKLIGGVTTLGKRIERAQNLDAISDDLEAPDGDDPNLPDPDSDGDDTASETRAETRDHGNPRASQRRLLPERYEAVVRQMAAAGDARATREYGRMFHNFLTGEQVRGMQRRSDQRDLQADSDPQGGYLKAPPQFVAGILRAVDDVLYFRQPGWATVFALAQADELMGVSMDAFPDDGEWTSEIGEITYDTSMAFGQRSLKPTTLAKGIKMSRKLLRVAPNSEALVTERLQRKLAVPMEKAYLTGSGANQPLGVFTASNNGIPTSCDVSTGNTATAITFDGITEVKYSLKPQYWANAKWLFHRDAVKMLAKIKNGNGDYIWRESLRAGEPDLLLGGPMAVSEYTPNTFTTGKYVGMYGDFSFYWIADALNMEIQRVIELYSKTRQIGLHAWLETDGMPVLGEAFRRVKLA